MSIMTALNKVLIRAPRVTYDRKQKKHFVFILYILFSEAQNLQKELFFFAPF